MQRFGIRSLPAIGLVLVLFAGMAAAAPARSAVEGPGAFIAHLGDQAIQVLGPSVPQSARAARFRVLFDRDFDLPQIARFVLGRYWSRLTPPQHQEFRHLFREFLVQSYAQRLAPYAGRPFHVTGVRPRGDEAIVTSQVPEANGGQVEIDWHVIDRNGHFLITDVALDGVSMKVTQRDQFAEIIQRNGGRPDALLAVLRQQLAQGVG